MVIIVYVFRTSKCGLLLHCSRFCSRQNRKTCIKYVRDNTDTRREENADEVWNRLDWSDCCGLWQSKSFYVVAIIIAIIGGTLKIAFCRYLWWISYKSENREFLESACCACSAFLVCHGDCGPERKETEAVISVVGSRLFMDLWTN